ncbi:MAG: hypothetical protein AAGM36_18185 [Cyanobacteria bacterium J06597_1]
MQGPSFNPSPELFEIIAECTEHYYVGSPDAEWPNNIISRKAIVYESGVIAREGDIVSHNVDPNEVDLCRQLSVEVRQVIGDVEVGMGSEATTFFSPFSICSPCNTDTPTAITSDLIRERFGGTIFPLATITVEPLEESGIWWGEIL